MATQRDFHNEFATANSLTPAARNASANENAGYSGQLSGYGAALFVVKGY